LSKGIAFFDFDGTITTKDTMVELIRYQKGTVKFLLGFFFLSPFLIAMKLRILSIRASKEKLLRFFFGGMPVEEFQKKCNEFSNIKLPKLIRPAGLEKIHHLQQQGVEVVVVSASADHWVYPWCNQMNISLLSTKLQVVNGRISGKIEGENCRGQEKVRRIKQYYDLSEYDSIYCFGDSAGDKPMLSLATHSFYKPFR
jgi:phosphatidylglycerophosphatase C